MLELLTPLASTIIGIGGAFLQRKHERKMFKQQTERMAIEFKQELALTNLHMKAKREETEQEIALTEIQGNIEAFTNSQEAENALSRVKWGDSWLGDVANFLRAITRPGITWYLVIATSIRTRAYYNLTRQFTEGEGDMAAQLALMGQVYEQMLSNPFDLSLVNMTAMVVGWWFGSRGSKTSYKDDHYTRTA